MSQITTIPGCVTVISGKDDYVVYGSSGGAGSISLGAASVGVDKSVQA